MTRHRTTKATHARLITSSRLGTIVLLLAAAWLASGFVTRMTQAYRLNSQVRALQADNQRIAQANQEYQQQLSTLSRPDGAEEQARQHNYVRPDEKVYVVAQPSPAPQPSPSPSHAKADASQPQPGFWGDLWGALTSAFH